jgi:hypothetical protein
MAKVGKRALVESRRNRRTGHEASLFDTTAADNVFWHRLDGRWVTFCEEHSTLCGHASLSVARAFLARPWEWCDECLREVYDAWPGH